MNLYPLFRPLAFALEAAAGTRTGTMPVQGRFYLGGPATLRGYSGAIVAGDLLLDPARAAYLDAVEAPEHRPRVPIVPAELGNDAGAVGAATLALEELGRVMV